MSSGNPVRAAVVGAGSFGTCLAIVLAEKGYQVDLWARDPSLADAQRLVDACLDQRERIGAEIVYALGVDPPK